MRGATRGETGVRFKKIKLVGIGERESSHARSRERLQEEFEHVRVRRGFEKVARGVVVRYHSEEAENQFMKDPSKAVLGDGVRGSEKGKNIAGGGGGNNKSFR